MRVPCRNIGAFKLRRRTGTSGKRRIPATCENASFPNGNSWYHVRFDNQQHIDKALPWRIERRSRDVADNAAAGKRAGEGGNVLDMLVKVYPRRRGGTFFSPCRLRNAPSVYPRWRGEHRRQKYLS